MEIEARLKALRRLVRSQTDSANAALDKEMSDVSAALETQGEYAKLDHSLDILDVIAFRFSDRAVTVLDGFIWAIESRPLKYSHTTEAFADYIAKYSNSHSLIIKAIEILVRLRYLATRRALDVLLRVSNHAAESIRKKALSGLDAFARYDLDVFYGVDRKEGLGAYPQIQIMEVLETLDGVSLNDRRDAVLRLAAGLLSPTIEGTRWTSEAMTLSQGATPGSPSVADVRRRAITLLRRLYLVTTTKRGKLSVLTVLNGAVRADSRGIADDKARAMVVRDTLEILKLYEELVWKEDLQIVQKIEFNSYWIFKHAISDEIKKGAHRIEKELSKHVEYSIYRTLVGFEGIFGEWAPLVRSGDYFQDQENGRRAAAARFAEDITEATFSEWRDRILLYASTESDDLATFPVFYYFLGEFARVRPPLALKLIKENTAQVAKFLIPILSSLWDGPENVAARSLIEEWIGAARARSHNHLYASARMFLSTLGVDLRLLKALLAAARAIKDIPTIRQIATVALARNTDTRENLIDELFFPAIDLLTDENDASWIFEAWHRKDAMDLFEKLGPELEGRVLRNLLALPKIDYEAEEVLSRIAQRAPENVIDFFCRRIASESASREHAEDNEFEAIPFGFDKLQGPLSKVPEVAVQRVYELYRSDPELLEFRGARLLTNVFPNFSEGLEGKLVRLVREGGDAERRFVVGILRAFQGQPFIHHVCKEIIKAVSEDDQIVAEIAIALETTGFVAGVFGMAEAYERKKQEVLDWLSDPDKRVREFAKHYISNVEKLRDAERQRAEESVALRKHRYGED